MITTQTIHDSEEGLFERIGEDTYRCTVCGSVDSADYESMPSFYAGGEDHSATRVVERREGELLLIPAGDTTMRVVARGGFLYLDDDAYETDPATLVGVKVGDRVAVTYPHLGWSGTFVVTELQRDQWGLRFRGASWDEPTSVPAGVNPFAETGTSRITRVDGPRTLADIEHGYDNPEWGGYGYLEGRSRAMHSTDPDVPSQPDRVTAADEWLLAEVNRQGFTAAEFFEWLNSRTGRFYGDLWFGGTAGTDYPVEAKSRELVHRISN